MTLQPRVPFLAVLLLLSSVAMVHSVRAQNAPPKTPPQPASDQMTNIPYFTLQDGMSSTLTLNNTAPSKMNVTVTLFNIEGMAHVLDPITLDPHSVKEVQLADVAPQGFESGNVEVMYNGTMMQVTCQVSVFSLKNRVSFESREQDMMDFESANLAGIMSLPKGADGFLAVTNVTNHRVTFELTASSLKKTAALFPRETQLIKLNDDERLSRATLVTLQHNGLPGDLITTGYVLNLQDGYSSGFAMLDPAIYRSKTLAGTHFRVGKPDPSEGFPEDTRFNSPLLLANVSASPVVAHVSVDYNVEAKQDEQNDGGDAKKSSAKTTHAVVKVTDVTLAAGNVQRVELSDALRSVGQITETGVDIAYDADPGSVIAQLTSVSQSGDYAFEVPIKDPAGMTETLESVYPWTIDKGTGTVLHLKNTTGENASAVVMFHFPGGGSYSLGSITFEPYESVAVDIQKLKESKKKDGLQRVFPSDATHGQVLWHQDIPYSLIGRAEETNVAAGIARSFSCNINCCYAYVENYSPTTTSAVAQPVGSSILVTGTKTGTFCDGSPFTPSDIAPYNGWTSDAPSIARVSPGPDADDQTVTFVGAGTTKIWGNLFGPGWQYNFSSTGRCNGRHNFYMTSYIAVSTLVPYSLSVLPDSHVISITSLPTCTTANYGIAGAIHYQVLDQNNHPMRTSGMVPQELILGAYFNGMSLGNPEPAWVTLGNATDSNGQFWDTPFGVCAAVAFVETFDQPISLVLNGVRFSVRDNAWTISSPSLNHGSITNSRDVSLSQ